MATALTERPALSLAECPDLVAAVRAGIDHGMEPRHALTSSFGKWMSENAEAIERLGVANFYDGRDSSRAMVNYSKLTQLLVVMLVEQGREIARLTERLAEPSHAATLALPPAVSHGD